MVLFLIAFCIAGITISGWSFAQAWKQPAVNYTYSSMDLSSIGCDFSLSETQGRYFAVIWGIALAFDLAVFALTLARVAPIASKCRGSLLTLFLRDGALYLQLYMQLAQSVYTGITVTATNVIASSLITRLMLNIRDPNLLPGRFRWPSDTSQVERHFDSFLLPSDHDAT
uniref:Uncharacterized protein n=1 Tax=Ganoderma boninense TaxID=34458 RepID=A0A5K1JT12_9APHY|nr:Uncharacterized protein [Ganoderma boninense]